MGRHMKIPDRLYSFIDYDNTIVKHGRVQYRASCKECGRDRGYKRPNKFDQVCWPCQTVRMRTFVTDESRAKQGFAMIGNIPWNKRRSPEHVKLRHTVSSLVNRRLKKRGASKCGDSFFEAIGYSFEDLVKHLESQFWPGMTWDNQGKWHIDHIEPDSLFSYKVMSDQGFQDSWALNNLQPLWAEDNLKKSDKVGY